VLLGRPFSVRVAAQIFLGPLSLFGAASLLGGPERFFRGCAAVRGCGSLHFGWSVRCARQSDGAAFVFDWPASRTWGDRGVVLLSRVERWAVTSYGFAAPIAELSGPPHVLCLRTFERCQGAGRAVASSLGGPERFFRGCAAVRGSRHAHCRRNVYIVDTPPPDSVESHVPPREAAEIAVDLELAARRRTNFVVPTPK